MTLRADGKTGTRSASLLPSGCAESMHVKGIDLGGSMLIKFLKYLSKMAER